MGFADPHSDGDGVPVTGVTLVTGATGFVGSHVAEALDATERRLRCTVRESSDLRWIQGLEVETVRADLRDPAALDGVLQDVDRVVHVAGVTRAPRPDLYHEVNVEGTLRLAEAASAAGVGRFVFVSSLAARGPDGGEGPVSAYGASKREAERRLAALEGEMAVVVLRPGGVYGPRDVDLLPLFRMASRGWLVVPAGGGSIQPIYVTDVAGAVLAAVEEGGFGPHALAGEGQHAWDELTTALEAAVGRRVSAIPLPGAVLVAAGAAAEAVGRLTGKAPALDRRRARDLARHQWTCDPEPAEEALGWRPVVELREGLSRTAAWYRRAGWI